MTKTHAIFLSQITTNYPRISLVYVLNSKLSNSSSHAKQRTTQNSKFKTQNSFIEHESLESNEYLDRIYD